MVLFLNTLYSGLYHTICICLYTIGRKAPPTNYLYFEVCYCTFKGRFLFLFFVCFSSNRYTNNCVPWNHDFFVGCYTMKISSFVISCQVRKMNLLGISQRCLIIPMEFRLSLNSISELSLMMVNFNNYINS